jgi:cytochrome c556
LPPRVWIICLPIVLVAAGSSVAASRLKPTMMGWKADSLRVEATLSTGPFDQAEVESVLRGFASDAANIGASVPGSSAGARDVKARFAKFAADAEAALAVAPARAKLRSRFAQVRADCRSCHSVYAN